MKKKFKLKTKFAYGGTAMNVDTPYMDLMQAKKINEDATAETMNDPLVSGLRGLGTTMINTGMSMASSGMSGAGDMEGIGGFMQDNMGTMSDITKGINMASMFALGGTTSKNTEVEGQEVAELPDGTVGKFTGPSHEKGGINLDLPVGTDIYSKRVKVNGVKMADRKLSRERQISKVEKLMSKNPLDKALKRTYDRISNNNKFLDEKDMLIQNTLHSLQSGIKRALGGTIEDLDEDEFDELTSYAEQNSMDLEDAYEELYNNQEENLEEEPEEEYEEESDDEELEDEEYATGGTFGVDPLDPLEELEYGDLINKYPTMSNREMYFNSQDLNPLVRPTTNTSISAPILNKTNPSIPVTGEEDNSTSGLLGNYSLGDIVGMGGAMYGAFAGRKNTLRNRAGDTPNINPYKDYGKAGLSALSNARQGMEYNRDLALQDLEASRNTMGNKNRNSARGINTLRALNLATDASINNTKNKAFADYSNRSNALSMQEANMLNQRDRMVMQGEGMRDMNDRRDRDAFFTNLGVDNQSISQGFQNFGKQLNTGTKREMINQLLNSLSEYFDIDISASGIKFSNKKKKISK